uniref:Histone-lysine N-methyltransferase SMYD3 n=1 Tax=Schistosoma mansoni TaxID=6183 RepID=A0A5K4F2E8_SCHMA
MRYCSRDCQLLMWRVHKRECKQYIKCERLPIAPVRLILRIISMQDQKCHIDSLFSHENEIRKNFDLMEKYHTIRLTLWDFLGGEVFANEETIFQIFCKIQINGFMITDPNGVDVGPALFLRAARLDHSCVPELQYVFSNRQLILCRYASSVCSAPPHISYCDCMTTTEERQTYLSNNYYFKCKCSLCVDINREKKITSLICCSSDCLSGPIQFEKLPSSAKLKECNNNKLPKPIMVRYCFVCLQVYDDKLINRIADNLYGKTEVHSDVDTALDALIMYLRCCQIDEPIQNIQLKSVEDVQFQESCSYYKLFGHKDSLYLARCCSRVRFIHTVPLSSLLDNLKGRNQYNKTNFKVFKDSLVNIVIASGLSEFYWRTTWLLSDRLQLGRLVYSVTSFLLLHISDTSEFRNCDRMNKVKNYLIHPYNTHNNFDCLGHVLCKFSSIAYDVLSPLAPYHPDWQKGMSIIMYYKAQDTKYVDIMKKKTWD